MRVLLDLSMRIKTPPGILASEERASWWLTRPFAVDQPALRCQGGLPRIMSRWLQHPLAAARPQRWHIRTTTATGHTSRGSPSQSMIQWEPGDCPRTHDSLLCGTRSPALASLASRTLGKILARCAAFGWRLFRANRLGTVCWTLG